VTVAFVAAPGGEVPARPCVAFSIGRKVGPAVVRNRLRRRLRDELAGLARDGRLACGAYLVGLGPTAADLDGPRLRAHLRTALGLGPSGPAEREELGPSGPAERESLGPSGPAEWEELGPSGPAEGDRR